MGPEDGKRRKDPKLLGFLRSFRTGNGPSARCIYGGASGFFDNLMCQRTATKARGARSKKTKVKAQQELLPTTERRSPGDFTRQENWLRGNTRTLKRQYAARNWTFVRVLPGIAGYCRVVGPWEKKAVQSPRSKATRGVRGRQKLPVVPPGTAWYRINFLQAEPAPNISEGLLPVGHQKREGAEAGKCGFRRVKIHGRLA
jgi:hypothetical protein